MVRRIYSRGRDLDFSDEMVTLRNMLKTPGNTTFFERYSLPKYNKVGKGTQMVVLSGPEVSLGRLSSAPEPQQIFPFGDLWPAPQNQSLNGSPLGTSKGKIC